MYTRMVFRQVVEGRNIQYRIPALGLLRVYNPNEKAESSTVKPIYPMGVIVCLRKDCPLVSSAPPYTFSGLALPSSSLSLSNFFLGV
ncbi:hypothetical protein VN97_g4086 [Penicillium thymicola]|uniref:Uncharacterized protein n=1 Tax=Penicillium thymicola TaxID=293382 RepID=A0AAI9TM33_PENTH|nr:hypothetical protein VN97_g4086 [Penicillium thymicola]